VVPRLRDPTHTLHKACEGLSIYYNIQNPSYQLQTDLAYASWYDLGPMASNWYELGRGPKSPAHF